MNTHRCLALAVLCLVLTSRPGWTADGAPRPRRLPLDAAFGRRAAYQIVREDLRIDIPARVANDAEGRVVVAGVEIVFLDGDGDAEREDVAPRVAWLMPDGRLDPMFGRGGLALLQRDLRG